MFNFPAIKIEIEHMKHAIVSALAPYHGEMETLIGQEIDKYLASGEFQNDVQTQVQIVLHTAVRDQIKQYFRYGDGAEAITAAVAQTFKEKRESHE